MKFAVGVFQPYYVSKLQKALYNISWIDYIAV